MPLFLTSLEAGSVSPNLTQAGIVIHCDRCWNAASENQVIDRAHRTGQIEQVFVCKPVAEGTIEMRMSARQKRKAALAGSLYSASAARKQPLFTENDLVELGQSLSAS